MNTEDGLEAALAAWDIRTDTLSSATLRSHVEEAIRDLRMLRETVEEDGDATSGNEDARTRCVRASFAYEQESDCCAPTDTPQQVFISVQDGGGGPYVTLSTERWAMDDVAELERMVSIALASVKQL